MLVLAASCGAHEAAPRTLHGHGYSFSAPSDWSVRRSPDGVTASAGVRVVSVTTFPLVRAFTPALWPRVVLELDRVAAQLARELKGRASPGRDVKVAGLQGRTYAIDYHGRVDEITFVLRGKLEYELLCRRAARKREPACGRLTRSFRPA